MFECLKIRNFRGFNELKIDQLSDINLIAGRNNVGKTSLLEAIFLLAGAGNAQMAVNINIIRGLDTISVPPGEPLWKQLFSDPDMGQSIEIEGNHTSHGQLNGGQAVRQESWQEIESESLLLGKAVTTRRGPESWVVIRKDRR